MNDTEKNIERLLAELGFPSMAEMDIDTKILISNFLQTNNPTFLLGIVLKSLKTDDDNIIIFNDYFNTKQDYIDFKHNTIKTINSQTEIIQQQTAVIEQLRKQQEEAIDFIETGKRSKDPTKH